MRAILIDPTTKTVTETSITNWKEIAPAIEADLFDVVNIDQYRHSIFVDDEGLYTKTDFFTHYDYPQPLAGKALIMGYDQNTGDSTDCTLTIEHVLNKVFFHIQ